MGSSTKGLPPRKGALHGAAFGEHAVTGFHRAFGRVAPTQSSPEQLRDRYMDSCQGEACSTACRLVGAQRAPAPAPSPHPHPPGGPPSLPTTCQLCACSGSCRAHTRTNPGDPSRTVVWQRRYPRYFWRTRQCGGQRRTRPPSPSPPSPDCTADDANSGCTPPTTLGGWRSKLSHPTRTGRHPRFATCSRSYSRTRPSSRFSRHLRPRSKYRFPARSTTTPTRVCTRRIFVHGPTHANATSPGDAHATRTCRDTPLPLRSAGGCVRPGTI